MKEFIPDTATLANGLRIIRVPSATDVVYCGYAIDAGTRDEGPDEHGLAHFVEHMLFKGTVRRRAYHILNRMENVGGDLNAYTNKEETVVYSTFLKKDFARALELLTDIVFHSTFPEHEREKEVEVILEEIDSYRDTPSELIFDEFEDILFRHHPLGHDILGTPAQLRRFRSADGLRFTQRYYHPANAVLFVQGNVPMTRIVQMAERLTADLLPGTAVAGRQQPLPAPAEAVARHRRTHQAHVVMGCASYAAGDPRRMALHLLNNLLGGPGMNSRLNLALRERTGLVYSVESNVTTYTDTGVFTIYFGCDLADAERCMALTQQELDRLCQTPLTPRQLAAARKQLLGQTGVADDNFENSALAMARTFLHGRMPLTTAELTRRLEALTPKDLQEVAQDLFQQGNITSLRYC